MIKKRPSEVTMLGPISSLYQPYYNDHENVKSTRLIVQHNKGGVRNAKGV